MIGEYAYLIGHCTVDKNKKAQWESKILLAIASGWMLLEGKYKSSYFKQYMIVKNNMIAITDALGDGFVDDYEKAFRYLRETGEMFEVNHEKLKEYVNGINNMFVNRHLDKSYVNSVSRYAKYVVKNIRYFDKFGLLKFENRILQALIEQFIDSSPEISDTAMVWHEVLY